MNLLAYYLQIIGLVVGALGGLPLILLDLKSKREIKAELKISANWQEYLEKDLKQKSHQALVLAIILVFSFGLQLIGFAMGQ